MVIRSKGISKMRVILFAILTLATLVAMISVRCRFHFKGHPNTTWIIYALQKHLAGNGDHNRMFIKTWTKEHSHSARPGTFSLPF